MRSSRIHGSADPAPTPTEVGSICGLRSKSPLLPVAPGTAGSRRQSINQVRDRIGGGAPPLVTLELPGPDQFGELLHHPAACCGRACDPRCAFGEVVLDRSGVDLLDDLHGDGAGRGGTPLLVSRPPAPLRAPDGGPPSPRLVHRLTAPWAHRRVDLAHRDRASGEHAPQSRIAYGRKDRIRRVHEVCARSVAGGWWPVAGGRWPVGEGGARDVRSLQPQGPVCSLSSRLA